MKNKRERLKKFLGVYQRKSHTRPRFNGKLDICFEITYKDSQRKKIWEKIGWLSEGVTAAYAAQIRAERVRDIRLGEEVIPLQQRKKEVITFGDVAKRYLKWAKSNKKSWRDDNSRYENHLKPVLADKPLKDVTPEILEDIKEDLKDNKKLTPATVKHCLVLVRQMFNKAINVWHLYSGLNPIKNVTLPKVKNNPTTILN